MKPRTIVFKGLIAFSPVFFWELFSLVYYGFLFPNTAYAKLNTGIRKIELIQQGLKYLINSFKLDPITPITIAAGLISVLFFYRDRIKKSFAIGILLYLSYVVWIGGDFMTGRFLSIPLVCSVVLIATRLMNIKHLTLSLPLVLLVGIDSPFNPIHSKFRYENRIIDNGIADERGFYFLETGFLLHFLEKPFSDNIWAIQGKEMRANSHTVKVVGGGGINAMYAGKDIHLIEYNALTDPMLSRLRDEDSFTGRWRIGHFQRTIPRGYWETLQTGINLIRDPGYSIYYDKLALITKGKIFDPNRLAEIIKMNAGRYDHLISYIMVTSDYFLSEPGQLVFDPTSYTKEVWRIKDSFSDVKTIITGPYFQIPHGVYKATYVLKTSILNPEDKLKLLVTSDHGYDVLSERIITLPNAVSYPNWGHYSLNFEINQPVASNVEFRVVNENVMEMDFDMVILYWDYKDFDWSASRILDNF
ncbi:hypothetical protein JW824_13850 [bacterium]|nr:hypothetical protein [bacterium]